MIGSATMERSASEGLSSQGMSWEIRAEAASSGVGVGVGGTGVGIAVGVGGGVAVGDGVGLDSPETAAGRGDSTGVA